MTTSSVRKSLFVLIVSLASLGQVMADLYLPSLPAIQHFMHADESAVQLTVFSFMVGFAVSQLVYGPASDAFGRKRPILVGLGLCVIGSLVCLFARHIDTFLMGRLVQGLGAGAGMAMSRAIMRDIFSGAQLAKYGSYLSMANVAVMTAAPFLGGYFQTYIGWHFSFAFLLIYNVAILVFIAKVLPETHLSPDKSHVKPSIIAKNMGLLLKSPLFLLNVLVVFFAYAGILAWVTEGPILFQVSFKVSPVGFGWFCIGIGVANIFGSLLNTRLAPRLGPAKVAILGCVWQTLVCVVFVGVLALGSPSTVWLVYLFPFLYILGASLIFSNCYSGALTPFPKLAGVGGALAGFLQIVGGSVASGVIAGLPSTTAWPMAWAFLVCAVAGLVLVVAAYRRRVS